VEKGLQTQIEQGNARQRGVEVRLCHHAHAETCEEFRWYDKTK